MSTSDLRGKPNRLPQFISWFLVVVCAVIIFLLSSVPGTSYPKHPEALNVVAHFLLYMVFAILVANALGYSKMALWKVALITIAIVSLYGVSDEVHQFFVPFRNADIMDWLVDTIGASVGAILTIFYLSSKQVTRSRKRDQKR